MCDVWPLAGATGLEDLISLFEGMPKVSELGVVAAAGRRGRAASSIYRPIICICNDPCARDAHVALPQQRGDSTHALRYASRGRVHSRMAFTYGRPFDI